MSVAIKKIYTRKGLTPPKGGRKGKHHSTAFHRIVAGIKATGRANGVNPYAVAMSKLGKKKAFK